MGEYSGILGSIETPGTKGVQAWVAETNAHGGLCGHPVKYVVYDTGGDPSKDQALTQRAVEQDHAIAFVYNGSAIAGGASVSYIQQHRVPVIGEEGGNAWSCVNSMYFPVMSSCAQGVEGAYQLLGQVVKHGTKVAAITCIEVPYCSGWHQYAAQYAAEAGLQLVANESVSLTQPDYTSACLGAKNAGATMLVLGMDSTAMSRTQQSCASVGYQVPFIGPGSAYTPEAPTVSGLNGAWTASGVNFTPPNAAAQQYVSAMAQYSPGVAPGPNSAIGWAAAQVFAQALQNAHMPSAPTSQDVLTGLWAIKGDTFGGLTKPLTYVQNQPVPAAPACWFGSQITNGKWSNAKQICH